MDAPTIPDRTAWLQGQLLAILPDTVAILAAEPRVIGIKDSAGDPDTFMRFLSTKGRHPQFRVLLGDGTLMVTERLLPDDGLVPGPANIVPHLYVALHKARVAGDMTTWRRAWSCLR